MQLTNIMRREVQKSLSSGGEFPKTTNSIFSCNPRRFNFSKADQSK